MTTNPDKGFVEEAFNCFCDALAQRNIVAGFIRFHPLLNNQEFVSQRCAKIFDRKTIAMDLTLSEEEIWET